MTEVSGAVPPLYCVDQDPRVGTFGVPCEGCPLLPDCNALAAAQLALRQESEITDLTAANSLLEEQNAQRERENAVLLARLLNLRVDVLVESAFTPEGLRDHLLHDERIQEEMAAMRWGILRLDGRFVNYINRFGNLVGDDFLEAGGSEITSTLDGLVRVGDEPHPERREQGHSLGHDIICRQGGDEFSILIRNVTQRQLAQIAARIQSQLNPSDAVDRYAQGGIPFIASIGHMHASQMRPELTEQISQGNFYQAFRLVSGGADHMQRATKKSQYEIMWNLTLAAMPREQADEWVAQPDDRTVAELFLTHLCPDFHEDPAAFLRRRQREHEEEN